MDFTIIPRQGQYMIEAAYDTGGKVIVERFEDERLAIQRLGELKVAAGALYIEDMKPGALEH